MLDWDGHKRTAFYFVVRESDRFVYCVGRGSNLGVPGGKGERDQDVSDLGIAVREFKEETGNLPPGVITAGARFALCTKQDVPSFVASGDRHHICTYFYRVVPDAECAALHVGASPEAGSGGEEVVRWVDLSAEWSNLRIHINRGIRLIRQSNAAIWPRRYPRPSPRGADAIWPRIRVPPAGQRGNPQVNAIARRPLAELQNKK
jgi:8-oxo-dGTP pyrophosphatase MutT (NUDIX family)